MDLWEGLAETDASREVVKPCTRCGVVKPLSAFHRSPITRDGRKSLCRDCTQAWRRERKHLPVSAFEVVAEKRCSICGEVKSADQFHRDHAMRDGLQSYCKACKHQTMRRSHLKITYGISHAEYTALLAAQGGVCAICGKPEATRRGNLHVDHDHTTGRVRGLLCSGCNTGIGAFQEDASVMRAAILYVERHSRE